MERLKAQRAARAALDAQRTEPETSSVLPPESNQDSTPHLFRGISAGEDAEVPHVENPGYEPPAPVTALRNVDASTGRQGGDSPASARSPPERPSSPLSVRSTQVSRVYGRNGEEFDFDFHQLSDVQCVHRLSRLSFSFIHGLIYFAFLCAESSPNAAPFRHGSRIAGTRRPFPSIGHLSTAGRVVRRQS